MDQKNADFAPLQAKIKQKIVKPAAASDSPPIPSHRPPLSAAAPPHIATTAQTERWSFSFSGSGHSAFYMRDCTQARWDHFCIYHHTVCGNQHRGGFCRARFSAAIAAAGILSCGKQKPAAAVLTLPGQIIPIQAMKEIHIESVRQGTDAIRSLPDSFIRTLFTVPEPQTGSDPAPFLLPARSASPAKLL